MTAPKGGLIHLFKKVTFPTWKMWRRLSSTARALPNFLIIGVQKGGTTSMYEYLLEHPRIVPALKKEVKFFDLNYKNGIGWYKLHFPLLHKIRDGRITGESSPYTLFFPSAVARVKKHIPDAKLIVLLRDPIERAFSQFQMNKRLGYEELSFQEALNKEPERLERLGPNYWKDKKEFFNYIHYSYLAKGRYAEQLQTWFNVFDKKQMLVLSSEALFSNPQDVFLQATRFLALPDAELRNSKVHNRGDYKEQLDANTLQFLTDYFRPHNNDLFDLLGETFPWRS